MALVWRIQDENNTGLYNGSRLECKYRMADDDDCYSERGRHPVPTVDYRLAPHWGALSRSEKAEYYFGFTGPKQLLSWVYQSSWHEEIHEKGFKVYVYEMPDEYAIMGATQACFKYDEATLISVVDIIDIT